MKIVFVVNTCGLTGGIKVVFEYANGLTVKGHEVIVIHLLKLKSGFLGEVVAVLKKIKYLILGIVGQNRVVWYKLDDKIKIKRIINYKNIPAGDVVFATANETADWVAKLPKENGRKYYLIQGYESWTRDPELVESTYTLPLKKITISPYLKRLIAGKSGDNNVELIENGIDREFFLTIDKTYNEVPVIMMQFHVLKKKSFDIGLKALREIAKEKKIKIILFGSYNLSGNMEKDFEYYYKPKREKLAELYREADIFINPSHEEGFGLTPLEAMASACAVVTTATGILADYAVNNVNSIIVPPGDVKTITQALEKLIDDMELRKKIGQEGVNTARQFSWESAIEKMENLLLNNLKK